MANEINGEDHESLKRRFEILLKSDNPHVQSHVRGFLDAMEIMHAGVRPAASGAPAAEFRGGSLKEVLSKVADHISTHQDGARDAGKAGQA